MSDPESRQARRQLASGILNRFRLVFKADGGDQEVSSATPLPVVVVSGGSAGQAAQAVTLGAGNVDATTQRVTLAADGAGVTALSNIDVGLGAPNVVAAAADGTGNYAVIAGIKRALLNWSALLARIPALVGGRIPVDGSGVTQPVQAVSQNTWTAGFSASGASVLDARFAAPKVSAGVTYAQSAGSLSIASGTNPNAEFLCRSIESFKGSMRLRFSAILSQRINNSNFEVLLADLIADAVPYTIVNAATVNVTAPAHGFTATEIGQFMFLGGVTGANGLPGRYALASIPDENNLRFTVAGWPATGTGTLTVFGRNFIRNQFTGAVATSMTVDAQRNGWAIGGTNAVINTTLSPGVMIAAELTGRDVFWQDALRASVTTPNFRTLASRYENVPDQAVDLHVFIWCWNGAAAPASSTTLTLGHIAVESFPNTSTYIQGIRSQGGINPLPVAQQGNIVLAASVNTIGQVIAQDNIYYLESTTNLAANANFTGTAKDVGVATAANHRYSAFNAIAFADQAGVLRIEISNDSAIWRRATSDIAVAANTPVIASIPVVTRHHRVVFVNGAAAQGAFMINSSFTAS